MLAEPRQRRRITVHGGGVARIGPVSAPPQWWPTPVLPAAHRHERRRITVVVTPTHPPPVRRLLVARRPRLGSGRRRHARRPGLPGLGRQMNPPPPPSSRPPPYHQYIPLLAAAVVVFALDLHVDQFLFFQIEVDKFANMNQICQPEPQFVNLNHLLFAKVQVRPLLSSARHTPRADSASDDPPTLWTTFGSDWLTRENIGPGT